MFTFFHDTQFTCMILLDDTRDQMLFLCAPGPFHLNLAQGIINVILDSLLHLVFCWPLDHHRISAGL